MLVDLIEYHLYINNDVDIALWEKKLQPNVLTYNMIYIQLYDFLKLIYKHHLSTDKSWKNPYKLQHQREIQHPIVSPLIHVVSIFHLFRSRHRLAVHLIRENTRK